VPQPAAVRYAWSNNITWANLFSQDGLPALTFGRRLLFDPAEVLTWLDSHRVGSIQHDSRPLERTRGEDDR
jgi:hypothetical protein